MTQDTIMLQTHPGPDPCHWGYADGTSAPSAPAPAAPAAVPGGGAPAAHPASPPWEHHVPGGVM